MAWTTPKTWSAGETLTAANFNLHIRDNELAMGPHLIVRKTVDESVVANTTLQDDDALLFPVAANEIWMANLILLTSSSSSGHPKLSFSFPASGVLYYNFVGSLLSGVGLANGRMTSSDGQSFNLGDAAAETLFDPIQIHYVNAGTAGNVVLRWAQSSAVGTTTIYANSTLWGVKLA